MSLPTKSINAKYGCSMVKSVLAANRNGVSRYENRDRQRGGKGETYQPCLYSFSLISTSKLMRNGFRFHSKISASEIGVAARSKLSMRGPQNRNQRDSGGSSGTCTKILLKYSIFPILCMFSIFPFWLNIKVD